MRNPKAILVTALLFLCIKAGAQDESHIIDSLKKVINSDVNDTVRIRALIQWDGLIYYTNPELDVELNVKVIEITNANLRESSQYSDAEVRYFKKAKAYALNSFGAIHMEKGEYNDALPKFREAYKLYRELDNTKGMSAAINNLGIIYQKQGNYREALQQYLQCLTIEQERKDSINIAKTYNNIGIVYEKIHDLESALKYFRLALNIKSNLGDKKGEASTLHNIGNVKERLSEYDSALYYYNRSLANEKAIGSESGIAESYMSIAGVYKDKGADTKALELMETALAMARKVENRYLSSEIYLHIGQIKNLLKKYKDAEPYCDSSLQIAEAEGLLAFESEACNCFYSSLKGQGKTAEALPYFERFYELEDSLTNIEHQRDLIHLEYEFKSERMKKEDSIRAAQVQRVHQAEMKAEKEEKTRLEYQNYFTFGLFGLALIAGGFIFNRFRITRRQRDVIEKQKHVVDQAYDELEAKNQEILDSINYAKRIQSAILPPDHVVKEKLKDSFILYKPKDIVAGDFYWMEPVGNDIYFAAADCTGHGVPGAMVSVVCSNALSKALVEEKITDPGMILNRTRDIVTARFGQSDEEIKDGMDIALCALRSHADTHTLNYAGANNPLWIIRKGADEVEEIKADKQPIGKFAMEAPFTTHAAQLNPGDTIYIFSDGYPDQFGGDKGKKFKSGRMKELLLSIQHLSMEDQKQKLDAHFESWRGDLEQIDDVCVIGVRI